MKKAENKAKRAAKRRERETEIVMTRLWRGEEDWRGRRREEMFAGKVARVDVEGGGGGGEGREGKKGFCGLLLLLLLLLLGLEVKGYLGWG